MAWKGDPRTSTPEWRATRKRIMARDNWICYVCTQPGADQCDHITPAAEGGTDDDNNLAAIHATPCHMRKTLREAARARLRLSRHRPTRQHPGLI